MDNIMKYKEYWAEIKYSDEDKCFCGKVEGLKKDTILFERTFTKAKISIEEAKSKLNKSLEITSEGMAIIPTEWKTEILCYEFKGKIDDTDFLVYTNVETGREENILVIIDTPNGILTQ